jgi:hypothetical protein
VVQRLDAPVAAQQVGEPGGAGQLEGEAGDGVDGHGRAAPRLAAGMGDADGARAGDLEDLGGVGEAEVADGDDLEGALLDAAVATVTGPVGDGHALPRQALQAGQQGGLVGLDREQVVGLLAGDQELGSVSMGVQCVRRDHHAGQVQAGQQRPHAGDLLRCAADLLLGQHRAGGVVHAGQQVHRAAVTIGWVGAAQRLAVDRHRPLSWRPLLGSAVAWGMALAVGKPGADRAGQGVGVQPGQGAADGGLGRHRPVVGHVAAGAERRADRLGSVGGPLGDGGKRAGAGQDRSRRHSEDGHQWVAAPGAGSWVGDGGEVGEQVRGFGFLELARVGLGEVGEGG